MTPDTEARAKALAERFPLVGPVYEGDDDSRLPHAVTAKRQRALTLRQVAAEIRQALELDSPHADNYEDDLQASAFRMLNLAHDLEALAGKELKG